jgi:hypothetical protein
MNSLVLLIILCIAVVVSGIKFANRQANGNTWRLFQHIIILFFGAIIFGFLAHIATLAIFAGQTIYGLSLMLWYVIITSSALYLASLAFRSQGLLTLSKASLIGIIFSFVFWSTTGEILMDYFSIRTTV